MENTLYASILLDSAIDKPLDYAIPSSLSDKIEKGSRVVVPVKGSSRPGTVIEIKQTPSVAKVSLITSLASDKPLVSADAFKLALFIAEYYATPLRKVIRLFLPPSIRKGMKEKQQFFVSSLLSRQALLELVQEKRIKKPAHAALLDVLLMNPKGLFLSALLEKSGHARSVVDTLAKQNILSLKKIEVDRSLLEETPFFQTKPKILSAEQEVAFNKITASLEQNRFEAHLLYGITGSGKTEIYLQAIEKALSMGKSALFLVPEISLTSQTIERLKTRFENRIALLHHRLSEGEKRDTWHAIQSGKISLVVGARSCLFSPLQNLGLIIVDEEHDSSYKQSDEMPCYHGRDVAVVRGKFAQATVILGSATPSLESYQNALLGKYTLSTLLQRPQEALLAKVSIIDMRIECDRAKKFTLFSEKLLDGLKKRQQVGEQSLLFLNRRGFHTSQSCALCGYIAKCPNCSVSLTFHKGSNHLSCHLCHYALNPPPSTCPSCHKKEGLKFTGAGTEQVERALHAIFPDIRTLRLDADTTKHKGSHEKLFKQFKAGKADVLIGTQMIAKGLHFPSVTLVGILNADASLQIPDFRSSETVFQLLTQVAGRSGRGALAGEVLIQTHLPEHPVIQHAAKQDYLSFFQDEVKSRKLLEYPPFAHLVKLTFSGEFEQKTLHAAEQLRQKLLGRLPPTFTLYPVTPCGYAKIKNLFRFQFLVKGSSVKAITTALLSLPPSPVRLIIDVDPLSTYF